MPVNQRHRTRTGRARLESESMAQNSVASRYRYSLAHRRDHGARRPTKTSSDTQKTQGDAGSASTLGFYLCRVGSERRESRRRMSRRGLQQAIAIFGSTCVQVLACLESTSVVWFPASSETFQ